MSNIKFKKLVIFTCVLLLQPMVTPGSAAWAKKKPPMKAFSFIAEGGKASQGECDGERKIPKLKHLKEFAKTPSYMGSELQDPEIKGKANEEMWKHFFKVKAACNTVLAKTPSSVQDPALTKTKPELPPDDSEDADDNAGDQSEGPDSE
ncbi:hypothetical protein [Bdellovibrio sp.]|uniref:hypothetical protein n=1 Tax=Bdellovibrio sp. TaxID=28201 RepID=UPI0039E3362B